MALVVVCPFATIHPLIARAFFSDYIRRPTSPCSCLLRLRAASPLQFPPKPPNLNDTIISIPTCLIVNSYNPCGRGETAGNFVERSQLHCLSSKMVAVRWLTHAVQIISGFVSGKWTMLPLDSSSTLAIRLIEATLKCTVLSTPCTLGKY
jgi:hypothetical protein